MASFASTTSTMKSTGLHGQWGFSASLDMLALLSKHWEGFPEDQVIRVLLVNPGDVRHIICTLSRRLRHRRDGRKLQVHFYIMENPLEVLARDLVMLQLIADFEVPIRQRATIFLEVYGNLKVQTRTNRYLEELSVRARRLLSKNEGVLNTVLDFSQLGYREKDLLENAFKSYDRSVKMDMDGWFDHRKRGLYEERYDTRNSLFDWDYHSSIKSRASIIHIKQFKQWRDSGIAFEFGDQEYTETNRSMVSYAEGFLKQGKDKGLKKEVMGYWGDIICSPYFAFGVDCETPNKLAEGLFEIYNKGTGTEQHRHHAVEVALYNLFSYLWEMETGYVYQMIRANDVYSGLGKVEEPVQTVEKTEEQEQLPVIVEVDENGEEISDTKAVETASTAQANVVSDTKATDETEAVLLKALEAADHLTACLDGVKIFPMTGSFSHTFSRQKYHGMFHSVFVSARHAQVLTEECFRDILCTSDDGPAVVAVETAKFLANLNKDVKQDFCNKIDEYCTARGLIRMTEPPVPRRHRDEQDTEDDVIFYTYT